MITDTHAHLDFPDFSNDLPDVLARAAAAGVRRIVTIGTTLESSRRAVDLANSLPNVFAAVGIHPNNATEAPADFLLELKTLVAAPRVVAIGEAGLDYFRMPPDADISAVKQRQAEVFRAQLDLAAELGLNVIIHERTAWEDTVEILREYTGRLRGVFHCFGKGPAQMQEILNLGHLVSFTGIVTFKNAADVQASAAAVPADRFMVETDCPFLAPTPFRGGRCEPAHTRQTAEKIAALRNVTFEQLAELTEATAEGFFRFDGR